MAEMTSGGVSTSACRRRGWTSRDSGAARVSSRKVKRKRRDRSSTWDDVPLGERVEGSPSRRPVRVRDAVQVALDARQERRGVRGVAHRARPAGARSESTELTNVPDRKTTSATPGSDCRSAALSTQSTTAVVPFPSFRERPPISEKGEKRRRGAPSRWTHFSARGARADGSRRARGERGSDRGGNSFGRRCRGISRVAKWATR